jgi:hypothetical protein
MKNNSLGTFVHANHHGRTKTSGMYIIANQLESTFDKVFQAFSAHIRSAHALGDGYDPGLILSDESIAQINALRKSFPQSTLRRCAACFTFL